MTDSEGKYGFRHDAMKWVSDDRSFDSALVRTLVFEQPAEGDDALIQAEIDKRLALQGECGNLSEDEYDIGATGYQFLELIRFGCDPSREEMQRAARFIQENESDEDTYGLYGILAFCLAGIGERERLERAVRELGETFTGNFWEGCPGTPMLQLKALWAGRDYAGVDAVLDTGVCWLADHMASCGCIPGKFVWDVMDCALTLGHPRSHEILMKLLPLVLRTQHADGGWQEHSLMVFSILKKLGVIETLSELPALPSDWSVGRSFKLSEEGANGLAWFDSLLWLAYPERGRVVALSPADGQIAKTFTFENLRAVTIWEGRLAVVQAEPYGLREVDSATGEMYRSVSGRSAYSAGLRVYATEDTEKKTCELWDAPIEQLSDAGNSVWYHSEFSSMLLRIDDEQRVLEWGEKPFEEIAGIAFDGNNLWMIDAANNRVCELLKNASPQEMA